MIAHWEIIQGSPEWHQIRYRKIGGTLSKGLLTDTDTLLNNLIAEHLEPFELDEDGFENEHMIRGKELEPEAVMKLSQYTGIEFTFCGWLQSVSIPLIGISPDAITSDLKVSAEIKCPAKEKHTKTVREGVIPSDYLNQCVHAFAVNPKLEKLYFCSYRPESSKPLFVRELTRDSEVDLGFELKTKVKEDRGKGVKEYVQYVADIRTVSDWVKLIHEKAKAMELSIQSELTRLEL